MRCLRLAFRVRKPSSDAIDEHVRFHAKCEAQRCASSCSSTSFRNRSFHPLSLLQISNTIAIHNQRPTACCNRTPRSNHAEGLQQQDGRQRCDGSAPCGFVHHVCGCAGIRWKLSTMGRSSFSCFSHWASGATTFSVYNTFLRIA